MGDTRRCSAERGRLSMRSNRLLVGHLSSVGWSLAFKRFRIQSIRSTRRDSEATWGTHVAFRDASRTNRWRKPALAACRPVQTGESIHPSRGSSWAIVLQAVCGTSSGPLRRRVLTSHERTRQSNSWQRKMRKCDQLATQRRSHTE